MLVANADDAIKSDADNNEHIIVGEPEKSKKRPFKSLRWTWKYNPLRVVISSLRGSIIPNPKGDKILAGKRY